MKRPKPRRQAHHIFKIRAEDEEHNTFQVDGRDVGSTNHDEDGWQGMEKARTMFKEIAKVLGASVVER